MSPDAQDVLLTQFPHRAVHRVLSQIRSPEELLTGCSPDSVSPEELLTGYSPDSGYLLFSLPSYGCGVLPGQASLPTFSLHACVGENASRD